MLRYLGAAAVSALLVLSASPKDVAAQSVDNRPNVLLIVTDDQRDGTLKVMPKTKQLFVREGTDFTNAYTTSPLCCPSRASIMTGRYPHNHNVRRNEQSNLLVQESTLQYYLQQNGYLTAMAGKYLNGWNETEAPPPYFDRWASIDDSSYRSVYSDFVANVNGQVRFPSGYSTSFVRERSVHFLEQFEQEDDTPWFMYVAPFSAHQPFEAADRYKRAHTPQWNGNPAVGESDRSDKPAWVQSRNVRLAGGRSISRRQSRTLMSADDMVEELLATVRRLDEDRDTLAFFISDNGYLWGEHGLASKRFPYSGAIEVPLMMRWPGVVPEGFADRRIAANIDIAPTVLQVTGITPDPEYPIDGRSLLGDRPREDLLIEFFGARVGGDVPGWAGLRNPSYQYVEYYDQATGAIVYAEYYDHVDDPYQLHNVLGDMDPTNDPPVAFLSFDLAQKRNCSGASCP
jgi:arylsulfatase A-like enzyme